MSGNGMNGDAVALVCHDRHSISFNLARQIGLAVEEILDSASLIRRLGVGQHPLCLIEWEDPFPLPWPVLLREMRGVRSLGWIGRLLIVGNGFPDELAAEAGAVRINRTSLNASVLGAHIEGIFCPVEFPEATLQRAA